MLKVVVMQIVPPGLALLALRWLMGRVGMVPALGMWVVGWGLLCGAAAWLLQTVETGEMSWKNYLAGIPLRWGYGLSGGTLWKLVLGSWVIWSLIGVGFGFALGQPLSAAPTPAPAEIAAAGTASGGLWSLVLFGSWLLLGAATLFVLGVLLKNFQVSSSSGQQLLVILLILGSIFGVSLWLNSNGHTRAAALVAGGPIALVAGFYGVFMIVILTVGRNARWN